MASLWVKLLLISGFIDKDNNMQLKDYMLLRNGLDRKGGIISAMNEIEFRILNITDKTSWAKKYKNLEITEEKLASLLIAKKSFKVKAGKY